MNRSIRLPRALARRTRRTSIRAYFSSFFSVRTHSPGRPAARGLCVLRCNSFHQEHPHTAPVAPEPLNERPFSSVEGKVVFISRKFPLSRRRSLRVRAISVRHVTAERECTVAHCHVITTVSVAAARHPHSSLDYYRRAWCKGKPSCASLCDS